MRRQEEKTVKKDGKEEDEGINKNTRGKSAESVY